ncbi:hypothetical protein [Stetteria hydrogenophila]
MTTLRRRVEALLEGLERLGVKVYPPEDKGGCAEAIVEYGGESFFLYAYNGRYSDSVVVKLVTVPRDCYSALLDPKGLIAILDGETLPAEKVKEKLERLLKIARRVKGT